MDTEQQIQSILEKTDENVTDDDKAFLKENAASLDDAAKERFGLTDEGGEGLKVEDIILKEPEELSDDEKAFLKKNAGSLSEDDKERFGVKEENQDLEAILAKEKDDLTKDEKKILEENQANLTPEQKEKFGIKEEKKEEKKEIKVAVRDIEEPAKPAKKKEEEEAAPEDQAIISKEVSRQTEPLVKKLQRQADENEVRTFIVDHPEYKKYQQEIFAYRTHEAYARVPVEKIAAMVAADELMKIGADKVRAANLKSKGSGGGGNGNRKEPGEGKDWSKASDREVLEHAQEISHQQT